MTDVFISYKREERARCVAIYNALVDLKLSVWFDAHIEPGTAFDREIEREVRRAKAILVLWSELACDSDWIRAEARAGKQAERLVAARLDNCLPPFEFSSVQAVDLFDAGNFQSGDGWRQIVGRIGRLVGRPGLGDYIRCEQAAERRAWQEWLTAHGDDPLAAKARERLAALEEQGVQAAAPARPSPIKSDEKRAMGPDPVNTPPPLAPAPDDNDSAIDRAFGLLRAHRWTVAGGGAVLVAVLAWANWGGAQPDTAPAAASVSTENSVTWKPPAEMDAAEKAAAAVAAVDTTGVPPPVAKDGNGTVAPAKKVVIPDISRLNCSPGPYIVFFNWDQSSLTPEATNTLDLAASRWSECGGNVMIAGHTDREGSAAYNVGMSQRMASNVRQYLAMRGIPEGRMSTESFGESRPRVATADGVREGQNRRVEVTFGPAAAD